MQTTSIAFKTEPHNWLLPEGQGKGLSRDSFLEVASHLSTRDLRQLKCTSNGFYQLITSDKGFVKQLMNRNWEVLSLASRQLKKDPELQALAFEKAEKIPANEGKYLGNLNALFEIPFFRGDKDVMLDTVRLWGGFLGSTSQELRADKDVVFAAVTQDIGAFKDASPELQADKEFVKQFEFVNHNYKVITLASCLLKKRS